MAWGHPWSVAFKALVGWGLGHYLNRKPDRSPRVARKSPPFKLQIFSSQSIYRNLSKQVGFSDFCCFNDEIRRRRHPLLILSLISSIFSAACSMTFLASSTTSSEYFSRRVSRRFKLAFTSFFPASTSSRVFSG